MTIVFVTHDQEEALHLSDLLVVMDHDRIAQAGPPQEWYEKPANRFVASFLGDCNFFDLNGCAYGIHPENVLVGTASTGSPHQFEAVLSDAVFLGEGLQLALQIPFGEFMVFSPLNQETRNMVVGQSVSTGFALERAVVLSS